MQQPLVSILMTVYNREKYIAQAIQSVLDSSYSNWELIIVDDQSTDKSVEIAYQFEKLDKRIKIYINEYNLGQFPNRNKAASLANGKYIKYLDSDDILYTHGLEVMVSNIEKFSSAGIAICQTMPDYRNPYPQLIGSKDAFIEHFSGKGIFNAGPTSCIISKKAFDFINGFRLDNYVGNDTLLFLDIAKSYPILKIPNGLIWWRRHEGQEFINGHNNSSYFLNDFNKQADFILDPEINYSEVERTKIMKSYFKMRLGQIMKIMIYKGKIILALKALVHSKNKMKKLLFN